ncbi:MAG: type II secretion system F family protein [Pirellulales bacterium]|nr:type II secretion system F family protein [Pirellulales bacterium]
MFSPRIRTKELAQLCRRLGTSLVAGIDMRAVWKREAGGAGRAAALRRYAQIRDAVAQGRSLADALETTGDFFPVLFRELAGVGEATGGQGEVFHQLAEHYEAQLTRQRVFLAAISWPFFQLVIALLVVGLVIWLPGAIGGADILRIGLVGNSGLAMYVALVSGLGILVVLAIHATRRGLLGTRVIQRGLLRVPWLGPALETLLLARLAWVLHLTLNTGMDVRRAVALALRSTNNARYLDQIPVIEAALGEGNTIHDAFVEAGGYPADFLDALAVGEQTGRLVESMDHLSGQYQDRAKVALAVLMTLAGLAVWALIALFIVVIIFRLFFFYLGTLQGALNGTF